MFTVMRGAVVVAVGVHAVPFSAQSPVPRTHLRLSYEPLDSANAIPTAEPPFIPMNGFWPNQ